MASQRAQATRRKKAARMLDAAMIDALRAAHERGAHGLDVTEWWRDMGCPDCIEFHSRSGRSEERELEFRVLGYKNIELQKGAEVCPLRVFTLAHSESGETWTALIFTVDPAKDTVIRPDGRFCVNSQVPADLWFALADHITREENSR